LVFVPWLVGITLTQPRPRRLSEPSAVIGTGAGAKDSLVASASLPSGMTPRRTHLKLPAGRPQLTGGPQGLVSCGERGLVDLQLASGHARFPRAQAGQDQCWRRSTTT